MECHAGTLVGVSVLMTGKIIIYAQFGLIVLLVYALSAEYRSNPYQQDWILANAPPLQYLLNGYLAAGLIGILIGGFVLLLADLVREKQKRGGLKTAF